MRRNVSIWAVIGFLIATGWAALPLVTGPATFSRDSVLWTLARITCPVAYVGMLLQVPVRFYWAIVANAATYALIGFVVEVVRRQLRSVATASQLTTR